MVLLKVFLFPLWEVPLLFEGFSIELASWLGMGWFHALYLVWFGHWTQCFLKMYSINYII